MSGTMAMQVGRVEIERSDMHVALNMAEMANGGFSCDAIEESQYLIHKHCTEVQEEKKQRVEFPGH